MKRYSFKSSFGFTTLFSKNNKIVKILIDSDVSYHDEPDDVLLETRKQIEEYFSGKRTEFDFPFEIEGTDFRKEVLLTMKNIPYGKTWSYSELAINSSHSKAVRAVGTVCKNNPLPLIIPCHRVIKKSGDVGYFNGGVQMKKSLLKIEKVFFD
jgi:methylated-DNA-[protein]-cysteine S-methyltransferase